jgi:serine/threonine protein kinase
MAAPVERQLGKWKVGRRIGKGGQARVFEARAGEASETYAIKQISARTKKKAARFKQEVEQHAALSAVRAPNIMPIVDYHIEIAANGTTEGYIVMPLAYGTLDDLANLFEMRVELSLEVFAGILRGVEAAHNLGIVHRDLKPANILFLDRSLAEPLVSDFGICLLKGARPEDRLTDVGETVGAKWFMAPEQERGGVADVAASADVYALGKLLYFMLTGKFIYRDELANIFTADNIATDPRLETVREEILTRAIVTDPTGRIQTAGELRGIVQSLIKRFRGGPPPTPDEPPQQPLPPNGGTSRAYEAAVRDLAAGGSIRNVQLQFDHAREAFDGTWSKVLTGVSASDEDLITATTELVLAQHDAAGAILAIARFDAVEAFPDVARYLEYVLNSTETIAGDRRIRSIPHLVAGFHYMLASAGAVARQAWSFLAYLLNLKLQWYYQSSRPLHSYALDLSYFFHPELLERRATAAHDFYRSAMNRPELLRAFGTRDEDITSLYAQAQFLMCIKAAQLNEQGETDVDPFADFGRFYGERVEGLLYRVVHDPNFAKGITQAFDESPDQWLARVPNRLAFIRKSFWSPAHYDWASIETWPE